MASTDPDTITGGTTGPSTATDSESDSATTTGGPDTPDGYEGFGSMTMGAESCPDQYVEVHVTNLDDDGPGSFRDAVSEGCRYVIFDLGGTITLASDLTIRHSYITVDGLSAPEPGITIVQPNEIGTAIEASNSIGAVHDIIIHHLRHDGMAESHENAGDIWGLDGEKALVSNIILDHITGIAATDGVFDVWADVHDVTISWNLIIDTVTALHLSAGDVQQTRERFSFHHNVFARNNERQIRMRHATTEIEFLNNVVYGWGFFEAGAAGLHIAYDDGEVNPEVNVIANVFHHVDGTDGAPDDAIKVETGADVNTIYFEDNIVPPGEADNVSNGPAFDVPGWAQVTRYETDALGAEVVPNVGTHYPTAEEQALLQEIAGAI